MSRRSANWLPAWGGAISNGDFKASPEHFQVTELLPVEFTGQGEHLWLWIEKTSINTQAVVQRLARELSIQAKSIGYAGRKDRHAVCRQWFSVPITNKQLPTDFAEFTILDQHRHDKKLSIGELSGNQFLIRLTGLSGTKSSFVQRLEKIANDGFPNYFGAQRFGRGFQNLIRGERMLTGKLRVRERNQRSMYLSACRSFLFNELLASRIADNTWRTLLPGDQSVTEADYLSNSSQPLPHWPVGWLPGDGALPIDETSGQQLTQILDRYQSLYTGIQNSRSAWHHRPLVMIAHDLTYSWQDDDLILEFALPAGAFATSLLRELITIDE